MSLVGEASKLSERAARLQAVIEREGFTLFWHGRRVKTLLFEAQDGQCSICQRRIKSASASTIDHVFAKARGGTDNLANFLVAHETCNHRKGSAPPSDVELEMLARVRKLLLMDAALAKARKGG